MLKYDQYDKNKDRFFIWGGPHGDLLWTAQLLSTRVEMIHCLYQGILLKKASFLKEKTGLPIFDKYEQGILEISHKEKERLIKAGEFLSAELAKMPENISFEWGRQEREVVEKLIKINRNFFLEPYRERYGNKKIIVLEPKPLILPKEYFVKLPLGKNEMFTYEEKGHENALGKILTELFSE